MCGIAGEIRFDGSLPEVKILQRICNAMKNRSPDNSGILPKLLNAACSSPTMFKNYSLHLKNHKTLLGESKLWQIAVLEM